jgi:hypothetical protein
MASLGFAQWATGVRNRMANDPGRADFKDQVQCHGHLFLHEYLDDLLTGPRPELVSIFASGACANYVQECNRVYKDAWEEQDCLETHSRRQCIGSETQACHAPLFPCTLIPLHPFTMLTRL